MIHHKTAESAPDSRFIKAEIIGGAHDGQTFRCPADQQSVTFYAAGTAHQYHRLSARAVFWAEDRIGTLFGGRK